MTIYRPGSRLIVPNARVLQPGMSAAASWWLSGGISAANCVAAYQPKGAASLAASYINLANSGTNNAAPVVAPTWNATDGWVGNGTTQYLTTGVIPGATYSMIVRYSNATGDGCALGCYGGGNNRFWMYPGNAGTRYYGYGSVSTTSPVTGTTTSGVQALTPTKGWHNGVADYTFSPTWGATTRDIYILVRNNNGSTVNFLPGYIQACAIYNIAIDSYISALTSAMQAL